MTVHRRLLVVLIQVAALAVLAVSTHPRTRDFPRGVIRGQLVEV